MYELIIKVRSFVQLAQHRHTSSHPIIRIDFRLQVHIHDEIRRMPRRRQRPSSRRRLIQRTLVEQFLWFVLFNLYRLQPYHRHLNKQYLLIRISQETIGRHFTALEEKSVDVDTFGWYVTDILFGELTHFRPEHQGVDRDHGFTSVGLHGCGHETLWEEECG